jgi:hypothetical protein
MKVRAANSPRKADTPEHTTPGRPKEAASRQQTQPDQNSQSGSAQFDRDAAGKTGADSGPTRPPGTK